MTRKPDSTMGKLNKLYTEMVILERRLELLMELLPVTSRDSAIYEIKALINLNKAEIIRLEGDM